MIDQWQQKFVICLGLIRLCFQGRKFVKTHKSSDIRSRNIFGVMLVSGSDRYKLKDATHIWLIQWKHNRLDFVICNLVQQSNSVIVYKLSQNHSQFLLYSVTPLFLDGYTEISLSQSLRKSTQQVQQSQKWQISMSFYARICYIHVMLSSIVELGLFVYNFQTNQSQNGRVVAQRLWVDLFVTLRQER